MGWGACIAAGLAACAPHGDAAQSPPPVAVAMQADVAAASLPAASLPAASSSAASPPPVPSPARKAEWSALLPAGAVPGPSARGDLDADGDEDVLVVYTAAAAGDDAPRALLVLLRGTDGALRAATTGPNAILCTKCGGMMGDPMQAIRAAPGTFTLRFEGGSRELWSSEYTFEYARDRGQWALSGLVSSGFDRADGKTAARRQTPKDFGDVVLENFDPADFPADALP